MFLGKSNRIFKYLNLTQKEVIRTKNLELLT